MVSLEQVCKETRSWGISPYAASDLHDVLRQLVSLLSRPGTLDDMLHALAALTMQALDIDLCLILLRDPLDSSLRLHTCFPDLRGREVEIESVRVDPRLWEHLCSFAEVGQMLTAAELDCLNPLRNVQYKTLLPVPLYAGNEQIGLLNCYFSRVWRGCDDDLLMLSTIANQAALAIKYRTSLEERTNIKAFVDDLLSASSSDSLSRRACLLDYDLARPHVVAVIELSNLEADWLMHEVAREERRARLNAVRKRLQDNVRECYPGSLVEERDDLLICLFSLDSESGVKQVCTWLDGVLSHLCREGYVSIMAGIGNTCQAVSDYRRGYAQACEALKLSKFLKRDGGCARFDELGAYRYLYRFAHEDSLDDQYQEQIATIVAYDQRKNAVLLDTLECYLECGGNIARTASLLDVHRNTLLQRMERLHKVCSLDLEQVGCRFPLLAAIKVHRLRSAGAVV